MSPASAAKPVLVILHQEHSTPGRVGLHFQRRGIPIDVRRPRFGDPLPDNMDGHSGAVIFGGPQSANDPDDFIRHEIDWIGVPLKDGAPFLGICLGAQMLARHLGARVRAHPDGKAEVGYYPLRATALGREMTPTWPSYVYQWHREGFELPAGASLLAEGDTFRVQAMHCGSAYAIQFHPEVTHLMMCRWTTRGHDRMQLPGAKQRAAHFADRPVYDPAVRAWLAAFLDRWIDARTAAAGLSIA